MDLYLALISYVAQVGKMARRGYMLPSSGVAAESRQPATLPNGFFSDFVSGIFSINIIMENYVVGRYFEFGNIRSKLKNCHHTT